MKYLIKFDEAKNINQFSVDELILIENLFLDWVDQGNIFTFIKGSGIYAGGLKKIPFGEYVSQIQNQVNPKLPEEFSLTIHPLDLNGPLESTRNYISYGNFAHEKYEYTITEKFWTVRPQGERGIWIQNQNDIEKLFIKRPLLPRNEEPRYPSSIETFDPKDTRFNQVYWYLNGHYDLQKKLLDIFMKTKGLSHYGFRNQMIIKCFVEPLANKLPVFHGSKNQEDFLLLKFDASIYIRK